MAYIHKIVSAVTLGNANSYVGLDGRLFYDTTTQTLRLSDGATPGGIVLTSSPMAGNSFADNEIPSGTINGINTTFTLNNTPAANSLGSTKDFTLTANLIQFVIVPTANSSILADYRY
ncbi:Uncharacterised protein [uncultured archaeon]|nr:Uncharacterised protein [uncultured archaeon]